MFASVKESALQQLRSCLRLEPTIEQYECRAVFLLHDTSPKRLVRAVDRRVALRRESKPNAWKFHAISPWHNKLPWAAKWPFA